MNLFTLDGTNPPSDQIYQGLRSLILAGVLIPGERLPSVRQVARDLGLATGTVAKVYKQLESEGLVITRAGAGTRVNLAVTPYPPEVLLAARGLFEAGSNAGLTLHESLNALRAIWLALREESQLE